MLWLELRSYFTESKLDKLIPSLVCMNTIWCTLQTVLLTVSGLRKRRREANVIVTNLGLT